LMINLKIKDLELIVSDDVTVNTAEKTQLTVSSNFGNTTYKWSPAGYLDCSDCQFPFSTPLQSTLYTVTAENKIGCKAEKNINVTVKPCNQVFIPNVFSPNDDSVNDTHTIFTTNCAAKVLRYTVFDRWGNQVFEAIDFPPSDTKYGWDGTYKNQKVQSGVYLYRFDVEFTDGKVKNYSGDFWIE
jgi:gliding motility-associated-like protein